MVILYSAGSQKHSSFIVPVVTTTPFTISFVRIGFAEWATSWIISMIDFSKANIRIRFNGDGDDGIRIRVASSLPLNVAGRLDVWGTR